MSEDTSSSPDGPSAAAGATANGKVQGFSPLPTGTRIGELVVQSVLGAGEFGITYVTEHEKRSKRYALKEYFPRALSVREGHAIRPRKEAATAFAWGLDRFLSEARALQEVKHSAIVSVLGVTRQGGTGYVGMTYENGVDFSIWLHERKRIAPQEELDTLLAPLLEGLSAAHANKVFHFDITPDCLMVRESGGPVLVDFGVFRVGLRRRMPPGDLRQLIYTAPELIAPTGGPIGPWTDVYSLAGLLYLAVTGRPPLSAAERASGATLEPAVAAAKGRYRAEFLNEIDAGLRLVPAERPRSVDDWSDGLLRPAGSRFSLKRFIGGKPARRQTAATFAASSSTLPADAREEPVSLGGTPVEAARVEEQATGAATPPRRSGAMAEGLVLGAIGIGLGSLLGAAVGFAATRLLRPECVGGDCTAHLMAPFAIIGAAVGVLEAIRYARKRGRLRRTRSEVDL